jgi:hypothetical protein
MIAPPPLVNTIKGEYSNAERVLNEGRTAEADFFSQINVQSDVLEGDNEELNLEAEKEDLIDFSDKDPFSEGDY